jgi:hypothetical protein
MTQLVARRVRQPGPYPGGIEDLVQPGRRQRPSPPRTRLQHDEHARPAG